LFLGRRLSVQYEGEMGNRFDVRIEGTRIKHTMGPVSLKLYDKFGLILRIETTVNDLTFFKHYREVEHRDGSRETKWASMQKTIYSLPAQTTPHARAPQKGRPHLQVLRHCLWQRSRRYCSQASGTCDYPAARPPARSVISFSCRKTSESQYRGSKPVNCRN